LHVKGVFFARISPERLRATRPAFQALSSKLKLIRVFVMAGLVPAIHVFFSSTQQRRGCPAQGRA
jgi:hypothetical protein